MGLGQLEEAKARYLEVIAGRSEQFGPKHNDTLEYVFNLACSESLLGNFNAALAHLKECGDDFWAPAWRDDDFEPLRLARLADFESIAGAKLDDDEE
jgi:hypothetical protein